MNKVIWHGYMTAEKLQRVLDEQGTNGWKFVQAISCPAEGHSRPCLLLFFTKG